MTSRDFLKPKNFKIKAKSLSFESVEFMTDLEKKKIYINFVKLLNNHFKRTLFKKNLYQHFTLHCGFIAHCNIDGFYGEYFETAANYHYNVNNYVNPMHECGGNLNASSILSHGEQFYAIYEEINGCRDGLGEFYNNIVSNRNSGGYGDYKDLDDAITEAFSEYLEIWREEIRKSVKTYSKFTKDDEIQKLKDSKTKKLHEARQLLEEASSIEKQLVDKKTVQDSLELRNDFDGGQTSLFDFMGSVA